MVDYGHGLSSLGYVLTRDLMVYVLKSARVGRLRHVRHRRPRQLVGGGCRLARRRRLERQPEHGAR